ncbi:MAG: helix-turn-helix domain-containing protein [Ktedonobacteraceae bacterium]|nr:helix-turn-helix domain-containing protein [Ktedonobacteraceae bacterium]
MYNLAMVVHEETVSPPADMLLTGHFKEQHGYAVYRQHGSGNWLVIYTLQGEGIYRQEGVEVRARPGDLILLRPDALHDYSVPPGGSWEFLWAHFQPRVHWLTWWHLPEVGHGLYKIHFPVSPVRERVYQAFWKLHIEASSLPAMHLRAGEEEGVASVLWRELALNGLEEVLLLAARENMRGSRSLDSRVQQVLAMVTENLAASHSLESLAGAVALSPSRLAHLFKREVGESLTQMLLSLRLNQAARLLEFTNHSIGMIAEEVGFHSSFYFSRQFRRRFGVSPQMYRARLEGG